MESAGALLFHRVLWRVNAAGRVMTSLPRSSRGTKSHRGATAVANAAAALLTFSMILMGLIFVWATLTMTVVILKNCAAGPWKGAAEVSPFSANWSNVDFDIFTCKYQYLGQPYDNVTAAESACVELNAGSAGDERACGGVGAEVCTEGLISGPFYTCDAKWLAVYDAGHYSCVATPPGADSWLRCDCTRSVTLVRTALVHGNDDPPFGFAA